VLRAAVFLGGSMSGSRGRAAVQSHRVHVGLQQAIDFMMSNPTSSAQPAAMAVAPSVPPAAAVPSAATPPPQVCHLHCFSQTNAGCDGAPGMAQLFLRAAGLVN
jgi:hypothetical protein